MINEISNKLPAAHHSKKPDVKHNTKETSARPELDDRSDLKQNDTVEISEQQTVAVTAEKVIAPVHGHDNDVHLLSDVNQKEANTEGPVYPNILVSAANNNQINGRTELTAEEIKEVTELQKRDKEVRQHEYAHIAAAGAYSQGVSFQYQTGPDGRRYAVGGEVSIDTSPVHDNPDATIASRQTGGCRSNTNGSSSENRKNAGSG